MCSSPSSGLFSFIKLLRALAGSGRRSSGLRSDLDPSYSYQIYTNYLIPIPNPNATESQPSLSPVPQPVVDDDHNPIPESEDKFNTAPESNDVLLSHHPKRKRRVVRTKHIRLDPDDEFLRIPMRIIYEIIPDSEGDDEDEDDMDETIPGLAEDERETIPDSEGNDEDEVEDDLR